MTFISTTTAAAAGVVASAVLAAVAAAAVADIAAAAAVTVSALVSALKLEQSSQKSIPGDSTVARKMLKRSLFEVEG